MKRAQKGAWSLLVLACAAGCAEDAAGGSGPADPLMAELASFVLPEGASLPADSTNRWADDAKAAVLGQNFFFDTRFSGPLLDSSNNGLSQTLGRRGETGKVACSSCHIPTSFVDTRSPVGQLSLASAWTHRKTPSVLDLGGATFLTWGGRRDTAFSVPLGAIESPREFNSSRLFVAQQIARFYEQEFEAVFGKMPRLSGFPELSPAEAGCPCALPDGECTPPLHDKRNPADDPRCVVPGSDDEAVTRIAADFGKAIQAYTRKLACGRGRFDAWVEGDEGALDADEKAGARIFLGKGGCAGCHSGPTFTDQAFHNIGVPGGLTGFTGVDTANDPGAAAGLAALKEDWLNAAGPFSDGDDGRLDAIPHELSNALGAFRTPSLRCSSKRPSYMHNGAFRSLEELVRFFSEGSNERGFLGQSELNPLDLTEEEQAQLVAFLTTLDGPGPRPDLLGPP